MADETLNVVVVGNGMVGHHFIATLIEAARNGPHPIAITVIGAETRPAYDRVHLSAVFAGTEPSALALTTREEYRDWGVDAHFGDRVAIIDRARRVVTTDRGREFAYDRLVLATGSYAFVPPIDGAERPGCLAYRTIDDLGEIQVEATNARRGVVVGGGLLGLECANALQNLGLETHVVEFASGLMGVQLDDGGSAMLREQIESLGVHVHTNCATERITEGVGSRLSMHFAGGDTLDTDMIVFSAGIRPYDQLARDAGLELGERGGVVIDYHCRTSDSDIFAIGECASFGGQIFGLVAPGYRMAEVAAKFLTDEKVAFKGADMSTKLKLLGVHVGSIGDAKASARGTKSYVYSNPVAGVYRRLVVDESAKHVVGAVLIGEGDAYDNLYQYYANDIEIGCDPEALILPQLEGGAPLLGPGSLPMSATICSCHNVTKSDIHAAIDNGALALGDVKAATKASTGCGGCGPLLKSVVDCELAARVVEVSNALCEHFDFSRQELFDIIRATRIETFDDLLSRHGRGLGCDICKPAVASMLASLWNEHVLAESHRSLQDTNDHFLANMQKNGTYSVVPRVPGGEITPDKLIVLGEVAKEFDLYTKITGGQRIDLFGAHVHQLPEIWRRLIDAGFETGHAYGKAMRTVKSCVGSTWCRYGVQDSVGMAIHIEKRYRGVRSPHKVKLAVSGCTRECAEAQSKDIGVIATENGWNLFVCGNGGMRPRHADLFATDIDDETLIKYIDRVLMFYIRTADRLQRTSVWLENLEGGLEYLQAVVIDDVLGIGEELEADMERLVETYQCEWKATLDDPDKLKRFRQFVNSSEADSGVRFVRERGQKRPAPSHVVELKPPGDARVAR
ncbi:MAG: nitrite reductase large subunit NirB [Pseudomonadota bacterium]